MVTCWHCRAESSRAHYARIVENKTPLFGPWEGWRMAGRFLVGPGGERITPERLRGVLWAEVARSRCNNGTAGIPHRSIVALPARELFDSRA